MWRSRASGLRTMLAKARRACCAIVLTAAGSRPSSPSAARSSRVNAVLLLRSGSARSCAPRTAAGAAAASGAAGGGEDIGAEDPQVVRPLERFRIAHGAMAHTALHLPDGLVFVRLHPRLEVLAH